MVANTREPLPVAHSPLHYVDGGGADGRFRGVISGDVVSGGVVAVVVVVAGGVFRGVGSGGVGSGGVVAVVVVVAGGSCSGVDSSGAVIVVVVADGGCSGADGGGSSVSFGGLGF